MSDESRHYPLMAAQQKIIDAERKVLDAVEKWAGRQGSHWGEVKDLARNILAKQAALDAARAGLAAVEGDAAALPEPTLPPAVPAPVRARGPKP